MSGHEARTVSRLRALAAAQDDDAGLLGRFLERADADAFAELVRRYGPLVLGVCRRVLGNGPDADDAFQAAFLVLARRAGSVRNARSVGSWLFGVARFAALRARDKDRRRREHEAQAARAPRAGTAPDADLLAAVDEELLRLPKRYRAPLVACFLQGRTQEDAARQMGCSLSTLRRRLEHGTELLRRRLTGRGAAPALGALGFVGGTNVSAVVVEATTALVVAYINGEAKSVPATVLAEGVIAMMARTKLMAVLTAVLVFAGLAGGGVAWQLAAAQPPRPVAPMEPPAGAKAPVKPPDPPAKDKGAKGDTPAADTIKPGDRLTIRGENLFEVAPLDEVYVVEPSGKIALDPRYGGRVRIDGLTLEEAEVIITAQVRLFAKNGQVTLIRYVAPEAGALEVRVQRLEKEVKELRALVDELRAKKP